MSSPRVTSPTYNACNTPGENDNTRDAYDGGKQRTTPRRTPLPARQLFVLCLIRFAEPISFSVIFPFVNQMIEETGVTKDPKTIGYYSGLIEGVFALAQFCTVWFWGSLSDSIGRRPVLILGLCGVVVSTVSFGLSRTFPVMLISRILSGALSGNSAVIKSVVGEITDETNQSEAFAYLPLAWLIGALVAPILGGFLSHPVEQYPTIFRSVTLFRQYPYLLPCLAGASFSVIGLIAGLLFLEESLPARYIKYAPNSEQRPLLSESQRDTSEAFYNTAPQSLPSHTSRHANPNDHAYSTREILAMSAVKRVLVTYGFMSLVTEMVSALFVLWLYTSTPLGGVGFSSAEIGGVLALSGILGVVIALIVFPPLERRVGATILFQFGMMLQVVGIMCFPIGHAIAQNYGKKGAYVAAGVMLVVRCLGGVVFVCNILLITRSSPSQRALGKVNALAQMVASISRAAGPAGATSLFAFSAKSNILGGNLVWLTVGFIATLGVLAGLCLPSDRRKSVPLTSSAATGVRA